MSKFCFTLLSPPTSQERLLDLLLDAAADEVFTSVPAFSPGLSHGRLSSEEQVLGRSASTRFQIILTEQAMTDLLQRLQVEFRGAGLRYWATALAVEGDIE